MNRLGTLRNLYIIGVVLLSFASKCYSQDSTNVSFSGYVKSLQTFAFVNDVDSIFVTNLIHNRINFSFENPKHFFVNASLRNLIYIGDQVKFWPGFRQSIRRDAGYLDLTSVLVSSNSALIVSTFDRLNFGWNVNNLSLRIGRQRVNWGVNTFWNPNDIFNTYNFLNFDYAERPGTDAIRVGYILKNQSNLEFVVAPARNDSTWVSAIKYGFNNLGYDVQLIAGNYHKDLVAGLGFAGNVQDAGWKTEITFFQPMDVSEQRSQNISLASEIDYGFSNGLYINGSILYNSAASNNVLALIRLNSFQLSPKLLMPAKFNTLIQVVKSITPLFNVNFSIGYSPKVNLLFILPYFSYSIAEDWEIDLVVQSFFADNIQNEFSTIGNSVNLRVRWSY